MHRSTECIITTHTGSLPRPAALEQIMFAQIEGNEVDAAELENQIRAGTRDVIQKQVEAGVDIVGDGEVGKPSYSTYVKDRMEGFAEESGSMILPDLVEYPEAAEDLTTDPGFGHMQLPHCVSPVVLTDKDAVHHDIKLFKEMLAGSDSTGAFMTSPSPGAIAFFFHNRYYSDQESYLTALADAMRYEYSSIVESGVTLQIDCPDLGCSQSIYPDKSFDELARLLEMHVEVLNYALRGLPSEKIRMHVCWGNYKGPHHLDIDLRKIVKTILKVTADGLLIEAANPRHAHEWQVWEDVTLPEQKVLIPGVLDTTNNYIEHPELVAQRIVRYAELVGRERVLAGSDCGFGSLVGMRLTAPSIAWAKLKVMAEGAALASRQLW